jgi:hypothetical protein
VGKTSRSNSRYGRAVQRHAGEVGVQSANGHVDTGAVDLPGQLYARHPVDGFGYVQIGEFAHVFGEHRVGEVDGFAFEVGGILEGLAQTGDHYLAENDALGLQLLLGFLGQ